MIRAMLLLAGLAVMLSACSGPIATRIDGQSAARLPPKGQYVLIEAPKTQLPLLDQAQQHVMAVLAARGWQRGGDDADYLLMVTMSERPAAIGMKVKQGETIRRIADPKKRRALQSCDDVEHRVTVSLLNRMDGSTAFSSSAAEYHCNAALADSMPFLVDAVLEDFGRTGSRRVTHRRGRE